MLPKIKRNSTQDLKLYHFQSGIASINQNQLKSQTLNLKQKFSLTQTNSSKQKSAATIDKVSVKLNQNKILNEIRYLKNSQNMILRSTLSEEIKLIEKKIRICENRIRLDRKKSLEEKETIDTRKEMDVDTNKFDFLTNPNKKDEKQEQQKKQEAEPIQIKNDKNHDPDFIEKKINLLNRHYNKNLRKKFERRQMQPHKPCQRKNPKLYITKQTNQLEKTGKPYNYEQHLFRVLTKEVTPQQIYPTIPNFSVVKDNISKNIMAYLVDYKPFIQKTKEQFPLIMEKEKKIQQQQQQSFIMQKQTI